MDGPTAFRILKYKVLEPYFQKNGLQSSEIQSEVITSFLDWILGPQFDDHDECQESEIFKMTVLELYCLHQVVTYEEDERAQDLLPMHERLSIAFAQKEEHALAWLSRWFTAREMNFVKGRFRESRSDLNKLFHEIMETRPNSSFADADLAFLRAVACFEYNYFSEGYTIVDDTKLSQGETYLSTYRDRSLAASDSRMLLFFSQKCAFDQIHFKAKSVEWNQRLYSREAVLSEWKQFIRQVAEQFGHHHFLVKVVGRFGTSQLANLEESLEVLQTAMDVLRRREDDDDSGNVAQRGRSMQWASLKGKCGIILLKLGREEEGKLNIGEAIPLSNESMKRHLIRALEHFDQGAADLTLLDARECGKGPTCWRLKNGTCKFFHPSSHLRS